MIDETIKSKKKEQPIDPVVVAKAEELAANTPATFDLVDDLLQLEKLNLVRAVMLRMQGGRHPTAEIDSLLQRRLDLKPEDFQGPYAIRLVCTLMMIFLLCSILWGIIWLFATALEMNYFIRLMSTGLATLLAAVAGIAVFHPASVPDEKLLSEAINKRMAELKNLGTITVPFSERVTESSRDQQARNDFNTAARDETQEPESGTKIGPQIPKQQEEATESNSDKFPPENIEP